jgi:hypothetical protein
VQHRIEPVQSLNGGLFVDAEDGGMLRRVEVQANNIGLSVANTRPRSEINSLR